MSVAFNQQLKDLLSSNAFLQIAPIFVLFLIPYCFYKATVIVRTFNVPNLPMVLDALSPWTWFSHSTSDTRSSGHHHSKKRKSTGRKMRRAEVKQESDLEDGYYPGLVNVSGTYCFMNSTMQALASLAYLQPQIQAVHARAEMLDVPTPVIDVLHELFQKLNTPKSSHSSIRPMELISVLSSPSSARFNSLFSSRDHQDAQELFQLVSECIKNETVNVVKEASRDRGLNAFSQEEISPDLGKSVFDGLTANRRSCVICQYTEAVMHFSFDNWQLAVPRLASSCALEDCLEEYTQLEVLRDCICRKCSVDATLRRLQQEIATLTEATKSSSKPSSSKKRRLKEVTKMEARVRTAIDEGRIEEDLKDVRLEKVFSQYSTKQAMIARPPPVLALHLNRSMHYSSYAVKNTVRVAFPELLDLTPYTTSGILSTIPTSSLSAPSPLPPRSSTPTPATMDNLNARVFYRLSAVVCHFGSHSAGHYICYRRKPREPTSQDRWRPPKIIIKERPPLVKEETEETASGPAYDWEDTDPSGAPNTGRGWLRISDSSVDECGIETVLREGAGVFMIYYERALVSLAPPAHPYVNGSANGYGVGLATPESSEETLKPMLRMVNGNASKSSLASRMTVKSDPGEIKSPLLAASMPSSTFGPRIVRSVAAGRGRSASVALSDGTRAKSASPTHPVAIPNGLHHRVKVEDDEEAESALSSSAPALLPIPSSYDRKPKDEVAP
ncbi:cysteine proteinase [Cylindrobasidium torrendii FP15055 ss-10]|uniref:ubiquitinyl hydrolase 1 n=1 Tax=Cylindrobasidium torrendii FP15055 ss-10 TaxID=1314674 RepID=A0A0D7BJE2_9AGAR|nr:cysteine proteinase [Cylindrobasidium torrendii FP15055 ss-10]